MKVSVVVPLYNTGPSVEALIDSLRAQTLPRDEWEAVFVDDGSTDDTADLVERLIAAEPNMRLLREAPSGWPGRPRNVGMDAARGDYVFFSDDDDTLGPEALERLTTFAIANDSDVVVPRTVGQNRGVPAMPRTVVDAQHEPSLIMSSLAPQKLFRRALLTENGIRFQEGHFRLEDHLFVVSAYLRARRVSTYADYPSYTLTYQPGRSHISQQHPDWHDYFASIRACLDRVDAEAKDPHVRRVMRSRWLRAEALSRLRGNGYAKLGTPELVQEVRQLVVDRYGADDFAPLRPMDRMLVELLIDGRDDDVAAFAAWESALEVATEATSVDLLPDGTVRIALHSVLRVEGEPPAVADGSGRYPSSAQLLAQVAEYTKVGVELQHAGTKVRSALRVEHEDDGHAVAVAAPADEELRNGRWTVMAVSGEHRTRRRRKVVPAEGLQLPAARRVGDRNLDLLAADSLVLRVRTHVAPAPVSLLTRVKRRIRRLIPRDGRIERIVLRRS